MRSAHVRCYTWFICTLLVCIGVGFVGAMPADAAACTAAECSEFPNCRGNTPYVCTSGVSKGGCQGSPWSTSGFPCAAQCDTSACGSIPNPPPACNIQQCEQTPCGSAAPYSCTAGADSGGCSADAGHWSSVGGSCTQACDASQCASILPKNPLCTEAQCNAIEAHGTVCPAWGPNPAHFACGNPSSSNLGGCSTSATHWQPSNCGTPPTGGCDTRVCNWAAVIPHLPYTTTDPKPAVASRTLTFENKCSSNIQVGYVGGAATNAAGDTLVCTNNPGACPQGTVCLNATKSLKYCYWEMPSDFSSKQNLKPKSSSTVTLSTANGKGANNRQVTWSGNVWAHTGCDAGFKNCKTAICPKGIDCSTSANVGPTGPTTFAEFTLQNNAQDYYDISVINGINVPIMMAPTATSGLSSVYPPSGVAKDYWCGAPGNTRAVGGLGAATWNVGAEASSTSMVDPAYFRFVDTAGFGQTCSKVNDPVCTGGSVCGLAYQGKALQCGSLVGWWTADEICGMRPKGFKFGGIDCNATLMVPSSYPAGSYADKPRQVDLLLCRANPKTTKSTITSAGAGAVTGGKCNGTFCNSCYSNGAVGSDCCGCEDWAGVPSERGCEGVSNISWQTYSKPWLQPIKSAVPTAYSYPYDDETSTFKCYQEASNAISQPLPQQANSTNYTITFCPGGTDITSMD